MVFKQEKWSPFTMVDDQKTKNEIKSFIKENMDKMSDSELMTKVNEMSDGETEYNWNTETREVETHDKEDDK